MKCLECGLHWTPLGGAGGQMLPDCPVCTLRSRLAEAERERQDWRKAALAVEAALGRARELLDKQARQRHAVFGLDDFAQPCPCPACEDIRAFLAPNTTKPTETP